MEPAEVVLRFLASLGRQDEAEFYLALFRAVEKERFAAIHVDASVARHAAEAVVLELRFLAGLGLFPVVALGVIGEARRGPPGEGRSPLNDPAEAEVQATRIVRRLSKENVSAERVTDAGAAASCARRGIIPILAYSEGTVDERFVRFGTLLRDLGTRKLIFVSRTGGFKQGGALVPIVNLTTEYDGLAASRELSRKQQLILAQARRLVMEARLTISITSPLDLLRELFTVKGAGTLLRRGAVIETRNGFAEVDRPRFQALIASSFGRAPRDEFFARPVDRIYLEEAYRGAAVVVGTPLGAYLTKFAVDREAQGEGIGRDLWARMVSDHPTVFWRARAGNPIGKWYVTECDGLMRFPEWHVFWRGLRPAQVPDAVAYALAAPLDIPPPGES